MLSKFAAKLLIFTLAVCAGLVLFASPKADAYVECETWYELPGECLTPSTVDYIAGLKQDLRRAQDDKYAAEQYANERDNHWSTVLRDQERSMQIDIDYWYNEAQMGFTRFDDLMNETNNELNRLNERVAGLLYKVQKKNELIRELKRELRQR